MKTKLLLVVGLMTSTFTFAQNNDYPHRQYHEQHHGEYSEQMQARMQKMQRNNEHCYGNRGDRKQHKEYHQKRMMNENGYHQNQNRKMANEKERKEQNGKLWNGEQEHHDAYHNGNGSHHYAN